MEFEDLDEEINREAKRVAAAFGVQELERRGTDTVRTIGFSGMSGKGYLVEWVHLLVNCSLHSVVIGQGIWFSPTELQLDIDPDYEDEPLDLIARGLYRLGFEDEAISSRLPHLSAHEQLELRLSLPRE